MTNFPERFIALRDKIEASLAPQFTHAHAVDCGGRVAALRAEYHANEPRKLMGIMPTGHKTHCHEFRMLFSVPEMTSDAFADWWDFAEKLQQQIVPVDPLHEFTMVSIILVSDTVDKDVIRALKKKKYEPRYEEPNSGWSSLRMALVDLGARKIHANPMGGPLRDLIKNLL